MPEMDGAASTSGVRSLRRVRDYSSPTPGFIRVELERRFVAHYARAPQYKQLDGMEHIAKWSERCRRVDGLEVHRSWAQIVRGLGWPSTGTIRGDRQRYRNNIANRLDYLTEIGWLEGWEPVYDARGESSGIVIRLRAPVAQLVRAADF